MEIKIKEDVRVGDVILEAGDRIEVHEAIIQVKLKRRKDDKRPFVQQKLTAGVKGWNPKKWADVIKQVSEQFTGVDISRDLLDDNGFKDKSSASMPSYTFKGKDKLEYVSVFWDTENPRGPLFAILLKDKTKIDVWESKGFYKK